jgi:hypothetical protein
MSGRKAVQQHCESSVFQCVRLETSGSPQWQGEPKHSADREARRARDEERMIDRADRDRPCQPGVPWLSKAARWQRACRFSTEEFAASESQVLPGVAENWPAARLVPVFRSGLQFWRVSHLATEHAHARVNEPKSRKILRNGTSGPLLAKTTRVTGTAKYAAQIPRSDKMCSQPWPLVHCRHFQRGGKPSVSNSFERKSIIEVASLLREAHYEVSGPKSLVWSIASFFLATRVRRNNVAVRH